VNIAPGKPHSVHILQMLMTMLAATFKTKKGHKKNITTRDLFLQLFKCENEYQIDGREKNPRKREERGNGNMNRKVKRRGG